MNLPSLNPPFPPSNLFPCPSAVIFPFPSFILQIGNHRLLPATAVKFTAYSSTESISSVKSATRLLSVTSRLTTAESTNADSYRNFFHPSNRPPQTPLTHFSIDRHRIQYRRFFYGFFSFFKSATSRLTAADSFKEFFSLLKSAITDFSQSPPAAYSSKELFSPFKLAITDFSQSPPDWSPIHLLDSFHSKSSTRFLPATFRLTVTKSITADSYMESSTNREDLRLLL